MKGYDHSRTTSNISHHSHHSTQPHNDRIDPAMMNYQSAMQKMYAAELQFHTREADRAKEKSRKVMHQTQLLKEQVTNQQKELRKLQKEKRSFLQDKSALNKTIVELQEERRKLRSHLSKLNDDQKSVLMKHKTGMNEMVQRLSQETGKRREFERACEKLTEEMRTLQENNVSLKIHEKIMEDLEIARQREMQLKEQVSSLRYELKGQQNLHRDNSGGLVSQIEAFKEDVVREKKARLEAESQNRKLYQRIESVMEQHSKLQKVSFEFERLMRENNSKNDDIFELQQKFDSVTAEKHQIMSLKIDLEKQLAEADSVFQRERDTLNREIQLKEDEVSKIQNELTEKDSKIEDMRQQFGVLQAQTKKLHAAQEMNIQRWQKKESGLKSQVENRKAECILLKSELDRLRNDNQAKQKDLLEKNAENRELTIKLRQNSDRMDKDRGFSTQATAKIEKFEHLIEELRLEVNSTDKKNAKLMHERDSFERRCVDFEEKIIVLEAKQTKFQKDKETFQKERETKDRQMVQHQLDIAKAREKINILESQQSKFSEYSGELRSLEREKTVLENELSRTKLKNTELTDKLASFDEIREKLNATKLELEREKLAHTQASKSVDKVDELSREMLELKQKIGACESVIDSRNGEVERLKSEVRELKMSKQTLDQQKAVLEKELNTQVRENQNLSMNVKSKGDLEQQLESLKKSHEDAQAKYQRANGELIVVKAQLGKDADRCELLQAQNDGINQMLLTLKENNQKLQFDKERAVERLEEKLDTKQREIERLTAENYEHQTQQERGTQENHKEIRESRQEVSRLKILNDQHLRDIERHKNDLEALDGMKEKNQELRMQNQRLEGELASMKQADAQMTAHFVQLRETISERSVQLGHLQAKKEELESKVQTQTAELTERNKEIQSLNEKCFKLEGQQRALAMEAESLKQLQTQLAQQTELINNLKRMGKDKEDRLDQLKQETSNREEELKQRLEAATADKDSLAEQLSSLTQTNHEREKEVERLQSTLESHAARMKAFESDIEKLNGTVEKQYNDIMNEKDNHLKNELLIAKLQVEKDNLVKENTAIQEIEREKKSAEVQVQRMQIEESRLTGEIKDLQSKLASAETKLKEASKTSNTMNELQRQRETMEAKIEALKENNQIKIEGFQYEAKRLKEQIQSHEESQEKMKNELAAAVENGFKIKGDLDVAMSKVEFLEKEKQEAIKTYKEKIALMKLRSDDMRNEFEQAKKAKKAVEKEKGQVMRDLWDTKDKLSQANAKTKNFQGTIVDLKKTISSMKQEHLELQAQHEELQSSQRSVQSDMASLTTKNEEETRGLQQQISNLEEMIAAQKEARSRREEEFMSLKTDMAKLSERNKVLSESNQTLTENNVELNNLKQKLLETGMDKQNAERHNKDLLDQLKDLRSDKEKVESKQAQAEEELSSIRSRLEEATQKTFKKDSQIEILKVQLSQVQKQKEELEKIEKQFGQRNKQVIQLETNLETARSRTQEIEQQLSQKSSDYEEMRVELSYSKVEVEQLQTDIHDMKSRSDQIEARSQKDMIALETTRREKDRLEKRLQKLEDIETKHALEQERRKQLEIQIEHYEDMQHNVLMTPPSTIGGNYLIGGGVTPDSTNFLPGTASVEEDELKTMLARIASTADIMQQDEEDYKQLIESHE